MIKSRHRKSRTEWHARWFLALVIAAVSASGYAIADDSGDENLSHFAVEIRVGPGWDADKPPQEQAHFGDHSKHLRALRESGHILMGSRYSDVGLLVFRAASEDAVRALMDDDPSMAAGTFRYDVHAMNIFYPWRSGGD